MATNLGDINLTYNAITHELTYHLGFSHPFDPVTAPLAFDFDLSPVASFNSSSNLTINASLDAETTFGVTLSSFSTTLTGVSPLPANGRLAGDATFKLSVSGAPPILAVVPADNTNQSRGDLVADVNAAFALAGVPNTVSVGLNGSGAITLMILQSRTPTSCPSPSKQI